MKIAVVTDSTCYLSQQDIDNNHLFIVPIPFIVDGKAYREGLDVTDKEAFQIIHDGESFPSTSQPALGDLINLYSKLADDGYNAVISIHLAGTISGLVNSLQSVAADLADKIKIVPYDSKITVQLMGQLAIKAARMAQVGADLDAIIQELNQLRDTIDEYFMVDDLQNLVRGGRLSNASAFIGSVLKIKPLLTFDNESDEIVAFEKIRSAKKAIARIEQLFKEAKDNTDYPLRGFIFHVNNEKMAQKWYESIKKRYPDMPFEFGAFGPVVGAHLGDGALALGWMKDIDAK